MSDLNLKLMNFDVRGYSEITRWILKQGDIPFIDERISMESWPERKKKKSEEDKKKEMKEEWLPKFVVPVMEQLENRLKDREWYVSEKMTWGDLGIGLFFGDVKEVDADALKKYPAIEAQTEKVRALPKIKEWITTRPVTKC